MLFGLLAFRADGFSTDSIDASDGTAWLLRGGDRAPRLVNINGLTRETTSQHRLSSDELDLSRIDVHQNGEVALLQAANGLRIIDTARARISQTSIEVPTSEATNWSLQNRTLAAWTPTEGLLWLNDVTMLHPGDELAPSEAMRFDSSIDVRIGVEGDTWVLEEGSSALSLYPTGRRSASFTVEVPSEGLIDFTVTDHGAVALTLNQLTVVDRQGQVDTHPLAGDGLESEILHLQQPGPAGSFVAGAPSVVAATSQGLLGIALDSGTSELLVDLPIGLRPDARPVVNAGCAFGLATGFFLRACTDGQKSKRPSDRDMKRPRLRVVRGLVYYEDWEVDAVGIWPPEADEPNEVLEPDLIEQPEDDVCGEDDPLCADGGDGDRRGDGEGLSSLLVYEEEEVFDDAINEPPVAEPDEISIVAGQSAVLDVLANDLEPDGDPLGVILIGSDQGLSVRALADRTVAIAVDSAATGVLTFDYRATDGLLESDTVSVTVNVLAEATAPPRLVVDALTARVGVSTEINVLFNDLDPDGQTLVLTELETPDGFTGEVHFEPGGRVVLLAAEADLGVHRFAYGATDGETAAGSALEVMVVAAGSTVPVATPDFVQLEAGDDAQVDLLENDFDEDGDSLELIGGLRQVEGTGQVEVTATPSGVVRIETEVDPDQSGRQTEILEYSITDGENDPVTSILRIEVDPPVDENGSPVPVNDRIEIRAGESDSINVLANDGDPDTLDVLRLGPNLVSDSSQISAQASGPATLEIAVDPGTPEGIYNVIYEVTDAMGASATGLVRVHVPADESGDNRPPIVEDGREFDLTAGADRVVPLSPGVIVSDPDDDELMISAVSSGDPQVTAAEIGDRLELLVAAEVGAVGSVIIAYTVADGRGGSARGSFTVNVVSTELANTVPVARDDEFVTVESQPILLDVLRGGPSGGGRDEDADGDELTINRYDGSKLSGYLTLVEGGKSFEYQPPAGFRNQTTSFTYTITDGRGGVSEPARVIIRVDAHDESNSPPVAHSETETVSATSGPVVLQVLDNDSDPDPGHNEKLIVTNLSDPAGRFEPGPPGNTTATYLTFTPTADDAGQTFSARYTVSDPLGLSSQPVSVTVIVEATELELVAGVFETFTVQRGSRSRPIDVVGAARYSGAGQVLVDLGDGQGAALDAARMVVFSADANTDAATATVRYTLRAGDLKAEGVLNFDIVEPTSEPPVANPDGGIVAAVDETVTIPFADLLANDRDSRQLFGDVSPDLSVVAVASASGSITVSLTAGGVQLRGVQADANAIFSYTLRDLRTHLEAETTVEVAVLDRTDPISIAGQTINRSIAVGDDLVLVLANLVTPLGVQPLTFGQPSVTGTGQAVATIAGGTLTVKGQRTGNVTVGVPATLTSSNGTTSAANVVVEVTITDPVVEPPPNQTVVLVGTDPLTINLLDGTTGERAGLEAPIPGAVLDQQSGLLTYSRQGPSQQTVTIRYYLESATGVPSSPSTVLTIDVRPLSTCEVGDPTLTVLASQNDATINLIPAGCEGNGNTVSVTG
ncbi:MAG: hypothetical protein GY929_05045, partial [Actinomycetia bacterium]|nr:hypothetical protein [Actinomycetes bacterium]